MTNTVPAKSKCDSLCPCLGWRIHPADYQTIMQIQLVGEVDIGNISTNQSYRSLTTVCIFNQKSRQ